MASSVALIDSKIQRFMAIVDPAIAPLMARLRLQLLGSPEYLGADPKGAGSLFQARYASPSIQLLISTVDGAAEVKVAASDSLTETVHWLWPSQAASLLQQNGLSAEALQVLQLSLFEAAWA